MWKVALVVVLLLVALWCVWPRREIFTLQKYPRPYGRIGIPDDLPELVQKTIDGGRTVNFEIKSTTPSNIEEHLPDVDVTQYKHVSAPRISDFVRLPRLATWKEMVGRLRSHDQVP
jgi:hypothetical protein